MLMNQAWALNLTLILRSGFELPVEMLPIQALSVAVSRKFRKVVGGFIERMSTTCCVADHLEEDVQSYDGADWQGKLSTAQSQQWDC